MGRLQKITGVKFFSGVNTPFCDPGQHPQFVDGGVFQRCIAELHRIAI